MPPSGPKIAKELRGTVEIRFKEDFAPVRAIFGSEGILVEDGLPDAEGEEPFKPDLVISGSLPQIVQLASAPLFGGAAEADERPRPLRAAEGGGPKGQDRGQPAAGPQSAQAARDLDSPPPWPSRSR